jgi:hypothetical protein
LRRRLQPCATCSRAARRLQDAARLGGRRLLSDCAVVGSVGKGGSIAILLLIGFVLGAGCSTLLFWWQKRRQLRIEVRRRAWGLNPRGLPGLAYLCCCPATSLPARLATPPPHIAGQVPCCLAGHLPDHPPLLASACLCPPCVQLEYRGRYGSSAQRDFPDVNAMVKVPACLTFCQSQATASASQPSAALCALYPRQPVLLQP